ncbi:hypothetical protein CH375_16165 [Leptospira ellisii]|nr:hypothetical protein CH375_16165 [Leptospira ellisii]
MGSLFRNSCLLKTFFLQAPKKNSRTRQIKTAFFIDSKLEIRSSVSNENLGLPSLGWSRKFPETDEKSVSQGNHLLRIQIFF